MSGGAGFITDMQNRSGRNQSMLGKRSRLSEINETYRESPLLSLEQNSYKKNFSKDEIEIVKQQIRKQNQRDRIVQSIKFGVISSVFILIYLGLFIF